MDETCDLPKVRVCFFTTEHVKAAELAFDFIEIPYTELHNAIKVNI